MPYIKENHVQVNFQMPIEWKQQLQLLALQQSVKEKRPISYLDLIKRCVQKNYKFEDKKKIKEETKIVYIKKFIRT